MQNCALRAENTGQLKIAELFLWYVHHCFQIWARYGAVSAACLRDGADGKTATDAAPYLRWSICAQVSQLIVKKKNPRICESQAADDCAGTLWRRLLSFSCFSLSPQFSGWGQAFHICIGCQWYGVWLVTLTVTYIHVWTVNLHEWLRRSVNCFIELRGTQMLRCVNGDTDVWTVDLGEWLYSCVADYTDVWAVRLCAWLHRCLRSYAAWLFA